MQGGHIRRAKQHIGQIRSHETLDTVGGVGGDFVSVKVEAGDGAVCTIYPHRAAVLHFPHEGVEHLHVVRIVALIADVEPDRIGRTGVGYPVEPVAANVMIADACHCSAARYHDIDPAGTCVDHVRAGATNDVIIVAARINRVVAGPARDDVNPVAGVDCVGPIGPAHGVVLIGRRHDVLDRAERVLPLTKRCPVDQIHPKSGIGPSEHLKRIGAGAAIRLVVTTTRHQNIVARSTVQLVCLDRTKNPVVPQQPVCDMKAVDPVFRAR